VTDTTKNQGTASAEASATYIYLSNDATLDGADKQIGERPVKSLIAGSSDSGPTTVTIPSDTPPGNRNLIVVADGGKALLELNEANNTWTKSITVTGTPLADLIVSVSAPTSAGAGAGISVIETTQNQGTTQTAASTTTRIYFSLDATLDGSDKEIGGRLVPVLNAGSTYPGPAPFTFTIPRDTAPGTHYLIAVADVENTVGESNETNNTTTTPIAIVGPDLIVSALSAPSRANDGNTIAVTVTTMDQGTATAVASTTSYYWSKDNTYQTGDALIGSRSVGELSAGFSDTWSTSWRIPRGTAKGTYYIIARADAGNAVDETNETNNIRTSRIDVK